MHIARHNPDAFKNESNIFLLTIIYNSYKMNYNENVTISKYLI